MDDRVLALVEKQEIQEVILRYSRAIDRCDWELAGSCFHDDAILDMGPTIATVNAREEYRNRVAGISKLSPATWTELTQHYVLNCLIELGDGEAHVETYCIALHRTHKQNADVPVAVQNCDPADDGGIRDITAGIRYIDRFAKRDGNWKITHRSWIYEWTRIDPLRASWVVTKRASRDRNDPAYTRAL
jgi:ketosteroid isomerase-like protein